MGYLFLLIRIFFVFYSTPENTKEYCFTPKKLRILFTLARKKKKKILYSFRVYKIQGSVSYSLNHNYLHLLTFKNPGSLRVNHRIK